MSNSDQPVLNGELSGIVKKVIKRRPFARQPHPGGRPLGPPDGRVYPRVNMPVATIGPCKRHNCKETNTDLADGLCVAHWDRSGSLGVGRPSSDVSRLLP
jgi:hypothetical protein